MEPSNIGRIGVTLCKCTFNYVSHSPSCGGYRMVVGVTTVELPVQSVPITTKVVSLNPIHGEVYSIQHYVIMFVSFLRQGGGFLLVLWFPTPNYN